MNRGKRTAKLERDKGIEQEVADRTGVALDIVHSVLQMQRKVDAEWGAREREGWLHEAYEAMMRKKDSGPV